MTSPALAFPAPTTATPDLAAIKQRQQATWSSGDYHMIGTQIQIVSELMIPRIQPGAVVAVKIDPADARKVALDLR